MKKEQKDKLLKVAKQMLELAKSGNLQAPSLKDFHGQLEQHDWHHEMSDDMGAYSKGKDSEKRLKSVAAASPEHKDMYDNYEKHIFSGPHYGTAKHPKPAKPE